MLLLTCGYIICIIGFGMAVFKETKLLYIAILLWGIANILASIAFLLNDIDATLGVK